MGRRLGQHFLHDPAILDRIVEALEPKPTDLVIEVGAGRGTLTRRLARRVGGVVAIEKDRELVGLLKGEEHPTFNTQHPTSKGAVGQRSGGAGEEPLPDTVTVVEGDVLSIDWHALLANSAGPAPRSPLPDFKVIGNIPYYITAPLIEKALDPPCPQVVVYLIQREVAERLIAKPGVKAYGALSIGVQVLAHIERLFVVQPGSFTPPPKVESAVVRLTPRAIPLVSDSERSSFRQFLAGMFSQRRKQIARSLRSLLGASKADVESILSDVGINGVLRIETLPPTDVLRLFRATKS